MPGGENQFNVLLLALGAVIAGGVVANLAGRGLQRHPVPPAFQVEDADAARGPAAIERYGCGTCHAIPGLRAADGRVGPTLHAFREKRYVGGQLPNEPELVVRWIRHPQRYAPGTAMPDLGVTEQDARDIAAYLYEQP